MFWVVRLSVGVVVKGAFLKVWRREGLGPIRNTLYIGIG